ncbi:methyltransferase domain-containing protein [Geodermatophilaceae bacterium NBWT11]|nr:methyltransferase domain-containing protein [Geodermatophilaceae bacterium NBWT11]
MTIADIDTDDVRTTNSPTVGEREVDETVLETVGPLEGRSADASVPDLISRVRPERVAKTLRCLDTTRGRGLEVGPLYAPMVTKDEADVWYVDIDTTESLRQHYSGHPGVPVEDIVQVDMPLTQDGRVRSITEAAEGVGPFDWAVASHVVEHVPDLVGWLADLAGSLVDDGLLALAVPDRRYCFDARRPRTTVGQMLAAHEDGDTRPSVRAVYDHHAEAVVITPGDAWRGVDPGPAGRIHDLAYVQEQLAAHAGTSDYIDCHVWLFTPTELVDQLSVLASLGLLDFVVEDVLPTAVDDLEYYVTLRRLPRTLSDVDRSRRLAEGFTAPEEQRLPEPVVEDEPVVPEVPEGAALQVVTDKEMRLIRVKRRALGPVRRLAGRLAR